MLFKKYNISKFLLFFSLIILTGFSSFAEDITITVKVVNERTGTEMSAVLTAVDVKTGNQVKIKSSANDWIMTAVKGQKVKITANAEGFYPEDKTIDTEALDGNEATVDIRLSSRPIAVLVLKTLDDESKNPVDAEIEIVFKGKVVKTTSTSKKVAEYRVPFTESGQYKISGKSAGYADEVSEVEFNVADPANIFMMNVLFKKASTVSEINFYNKSTNERVSSGNLIIKQKSDGRPVFQGDFKDGKHKFDAKRNDILIVQTKAKGFNNGEFEVKNTGAPIILSLVPETVIEVDVFDNLTDKRLAAEVSVELPSKKVVKFKASDKESVRFMPTETGTYHFEASFKGYNHKLGTLEVKTISGNNSLFAMRLDKVAEDYVISVFDAATKVQLKAAKIRVFDEKQNEVNMNENFGKPIIDPDKKYSFEVTADGYEDVKSAISENRKIEVFMKKKDPLDYSFIVYDSQTGKPMEDCRFRIFDAKNVPVQCAFDPVSKKYTAKIGTGGPYSMEASAKGYMNFKGSLTVNSNRLTTLTLSPVASESYTFQVYDAITGLNIPADFKLTSNGVNDNLLNTSGIKSVTAKLSPVNIYEMEASAKGYDPVKVKVGPQGVTNGIFRILVKKSFYEAGIQITNELTAEQLKQLDVAASLPKVMNVQLTSKGQVYYGLFKPDVIYSIKVALKGFNTVSDSLLLAKLGQQSPESLILPITLVSSKKEVKKEPEPVKVMSKEIVDLPDNLNSLVSEFLRPEALGKTYRLNKVNFEKSKPKMLDGSNLQLDLLAAGLTQHKNFQIEITGHTDSDGNDQRLNQYLSEFRAKVIANYLFNKGINHERITVKGKGSSEPLVPNDSDENKAKNRRVEVRIIDLNP